MMTTEDEDGKSVDIPTSQCKVNVVGKFYQVGSYPEDLHEGSFVSLREVN